MPKPAPGIVSHDRGEPVTNPFMVTGPFTNFVNF